MRTFLLFCASLMFFSCERSLPNEDKSLIFEKLDKMQNKLRANELADCRDNAILQAEIYVDSIIYDIKRFTVLEDSIEMISKPKRPDRPDYIKIEDPGPIEPFSDKKNPPFNKK